MSYLDNRIDNTFRKQNINVLYNCLGNDSSTINSFVKNVNDLFSTSNRHSTHFIKPAIYDTFFTFERREKKTGFESLKNLENFWRKENKHSEMADNWDFPLRSFEIFKNDKESYIENLKNQLKKIENPMIFFSGGLDSELLLNCFISDNLPCKVCIFEFKDLQGNNINQFDLDYAYKFCRKHSINPIIRSIVLEDLWKSDQFKLKSKEFKLNSPQISTHVWMIYLMNEEFPGHTYCFAGECRYTNNVFDENNKSVIVQHAKVDPGWGSEYSVEHTGSATGQAFSVNFYVNNIGQWSCFPSGSYNLWAPYGNAESGTFTTTPSRAYNLYMIVSDWYLNYGTGSTYAKGGPWTYQNGPAETIAYAQAYRVSGGALKQGSFTFYIQSTGSSSTYIFANSTLRAEYVS